MSTVQTVLLWIERYSVTILIIKQETKIGHNDTMVQCTNGGSYMWVTEIMNGYSARKGQYEWQEENEELISEALERLEVL